STREPAAMWVTRRRCAEDDEDGEGETSGDPPCEAEEEDEPVSRRNSAMVSFDERLSMKNGGFLCPYNAERRPALAHRTARRNRESLERATGLEPATSSLGSLHSTS